MHDLDQLIAGLTAVLGALASEITSVWLLIQLGLLVLCAAASFGLAGFLRRRIDPAGATSGWPLMLRNAVRLLVDNAGAIIFIFLTLALDASIGAYGLPARSYVLPVAGRLAIAWVLIHLVTNLIENRFIVHVAALTAWMIAALSILGLLDSTTAALDSMAIVVGGFRLSLLLVFKLAILLLLTLWAAVAISNFVERRIERWGELTPSIQVLISKVVRLALIVSAILVVLSSSGIDLTALAWFSGAVGVGVGFGLQKIVSNLVSGIILLADKSVKPGDVITVGDTFGSVNEMGTRYVAVVTRDGREILIPNEDLVTRQVVNWSYTKDDIRLDAKFSVDPASNPHRVRAVAVAAAASVARVLPQPAPVCHMLSVDARGMEFSLRFWINDPVEGVTNVRGFVMLALWDAFKREGIAFPSPIQDVRLRGITRATLEGADAASRPTGPSAD